MKLVRKLVLLFYVFILTLLNDIVFADVRSIIASYNQTQGFSGFIPTIRYAFDSDNYLSRSWTSQIFSLVRI